MVAMDTPLMTLKSLELTQAAAKALMEARNPGARITAVRMISNKDS